MTGVSSRRRSSGDSSRRYFCRSSEATSLWASNAPISRSLRFSSLRVRASEPKAGTIKHLREQEDRPAEQRQKDHDSS